MKGIIIYKTACGSTEQYAGWISEETGFAAVPLAQAKKMDLGTFDVIVAGSLVIAGKLVISKWLTGKWDTIARNKIVLFSTSGAKPDQKLKEEFLSRSFPPDIARRVDYFPFHGRRRRKDLSVTAKLMMWIAATFIARNPREKEEMRKDFDGVDRKYIRPLVAHIKALGSGEPDAPKTPAMACI